MVDILHEFLSESQECLDQLDLDFITLEQNPNDTDRLASVFRTIHTIKGTSGLLGFPTLERLTHTGEILLDRLRSSNSALSPGTASLLLELVDAVREQLDLIVTTGADGGDYSELVQRLKTMQAGGECVDSSTTGGKGSSEPLQEGMAAPASAAASDDDLSVAVIEPQPADENSDSGQTDGLSDFIDDDEELPEDPVVMELDDEMAEVLKDFLQESYENLDRVDSELIELEEDPGNRDLLASIFRSMHTIKGTCGFFGFDTLEKVTHVGENLLVKLRDGKYSMTEEIATGLLAMVDAVRAMLLEISNNGHDGRKTYRRLVQTLSELKDHGELKDSDAVPVASRSSVETDQGEASEIFETTVKELKPLTSEEDSGESSSVAKDTTPVLSAVESKPRADKPAGGSGSDGNKKPANVVEASIRVDVPVLDSLMNLVGELVLARNQIVEYVGTHENTQVVAAAQRLNLITSELQEGVMQTRMQPIHSVWAKLPRVVRDLSRACGKQIRVEMEGKSTELDKSLIEAMKDPITHLVRNSVDHGVEPPEQRIAAGKPAEGVLLLRAFHEGGQVHIEISDDGAGIKAEKIKSKAIEKGVVTAEQASKMSDQEICKMIFLPGLSTAEAVTNISGRGVGMDVVKTNIERISGAIDLDTEVGRGTVFKIRVPLTLAIVPALIVSSGGQRFAIPQVNLIELIRVSEDDQSNSIELIHGCPVYRLRGQLLSLAYLNKELMLNASSEGALNIVVLQAEKCRFGLVVDQINDTQEIVVKPLAEALKNISVFAGATIMGDGRVALILDTLGIGQRARVIHDNPKRHVNVPRSDEAERVGQSETLLLVSTSNEGRLAIPLRRVARLEQFEVTSTEVAGDIQVVQYRNQILPLIKLSEFLHERRGDDMPEQEEDGELIQVVVFGDVGWQIGLIVKDIIDVVDEVLEVRGRASRPGVLGTAAIHGQVTELFDVTAFVEKTSNLMIEREVAA